MGLSKLAARDPAVHKLTTEVQNLLKSRAVSTRTPGIMTE